MAACLVRTMFPTFMDLDLVGPFSPPVDFDFDRQFFRSI
jgi:hypothetical protein